MSDRPRGFLPMCDMFDDMLYEGGLIREEFKRQREEDWSREDERRKEVIDRMIPHLKKESLKNKDVKVLWVRQKLKDGLYANREVEYNTKVATYINSEGQPISFDLCDSNLYSICGMFPYSGDSKPRCFFKISLKPQENFRPFVLTIGNCVFNKEAECVKFSPCSYMNELSGDFADWIIFNFDIRKDKKTAVWAITEDLPIKCAKITWD